MCEMENTVKLLSFHDGKNCRTTDAYIYICLYIVYAITITIDSFPFLISWTHTLLPLLFIHRFFAFISLFYFLKLTTFFLLKLIILTLGQPYTNRLLLLIFTLA